MATKKKTEEVQENNTVVTTPAEQEGAQESGIMESEKEAAHDEPAQASVETPEASAALETNVAQAPVLESLSVLADRHRVPGWQQAALARFMGWADGKMLTDDEYREALKKLASRHIGGGRRK